MLLCHPVSRRQYQLAGAFGRDTLDLERFLSSLGKLLGGAEAPLVEQLGVDVSDTWNRVERSTRRARLFLGLRIAAQIDLPSGEPMSQPHVLTALADRQRKLVVRNDHLHAVLVLIDNHLGN